MSEKKTTKNPKLDAKALAAKVEELTLALQRERADAMNVRRRAEEDRVKLASFFKASVIKDLIPFIDNLDRAMQHAPKLEDATYSEWLKGLEGVEKQLWTSLESIGVQKIKTIGEEFNPELHEAVQMDDSNPGKKEIITEEYTSGYILGDEVLRHAMVKVTLQ